MQSPCVALLSFLYLIALVSNSVLAQSKHEENHSATLKDRGCTKLLQRKEWRVLSDGEKVAYTGAVKCLMSLPAQNPALPEAKTRFDEFQALHLHLADNVHRVGQFLPWHRQYLLSYERALRNECGYQAATPYWDWSLDAYNISASPIWDPVTGFGGSGVPGTYRLPKGVNYTENLIFPESFVGCVMDGPFANYTVRLGPGLLRTNHCLTRAVDQSYTGYITYEAVAKTLRLPTFEQFRLELEGGQAAHKMHDGGHYMVGGEMSNFYSSPIDPLFFLHHANLDRIWWNWQQMLPGRLAEVSGYSTYEPPHVNITLDFELYVGSVGDSVPIREVMDIHKAPNCYTYV
ncbi:hypothetical protein NLJ89_g1692 [Agrocybe chaxingu]|uniref:Tyrosinase copper-binding domain-containing protein n=1 Tax=Agrocybe chaxingu TaxID=84603 RepID=A0A9W8MZK8_9AGAR|nr:hypothetical protein NLJ89_g1692 [Agrocybe chaxingu]